MRKNLKLRNIKLALKAWYELLLMNVIKIVKNSSLLLFQAASCFQCGGNTLLMMWNVASALLLCQECTKLCLGRYTK
jgi:hypothetical protein